MILDLVLFLACLAFFHTSEFALAWIFNPSDLSRDSWLFSRHYCLAMGLALSEYFCERALAPGWKRPSPVMWAGLLLVLLGEALRKAAILTAGPSFTLDVKTHRRPHHHLVTRGVYRLCRHPGYLGWTLWCVGTQVLLRNVVCSAVFAAWSWKFFAHRIPYEEMLLLEMFGERYRDYAAKTRLWLPFIESPCERTEHSEWPDL